ncbi:CENP-B homolog protein 1-like [Gossypium hirsutum]|uniref:CENP-B homolog protein 1-like n=1 Tax=Gossypium hirsutum TaxID=3635 RepID=A0A1U8ISY8_GOSHI|nr:CENP-B homolog protein 1-like [Gossypium hirsutum]
MASHLKGVKKSTLTDEMRKTLCEYKNEHPSSSQKDLQQWVQQTFDLSISQSTISNTLKRSSEYLSKDINNSNVKMHKLAKYLKLEKVLYEWFLQYQEKVNMTGEMIQTKTKEFLQKMYGDANSEFNFLISWLEWFKARHGIKSYRRFGESGSVVMENIEDALPQIKAKLENFDWKDIYNNMDETSIFYRLQADHSLATKQLE